MKLQYDAVKFVLEQGDEYTKLHLFQLIDLSDTKEAKSTLLNLLNQQMPSGGFPSKYDMKTEGIRETCRYALLLLRYGIPSDGPNIQAAVEFLIKHQRDDGGWSENPALRIPKSVVELTTSKSVTWLTGDIIRLLHVVGLGESEACNKALIWLRGMQKANGGWPMFRRDQFRVDPDSTAQILFMMKEFFGKDDPAWLRGAKFYGECLDNVAKEVEKGYHITPRGVRRENEIYHLTHLLLSSLADSDERIKSGYNLKDRRVEKIVKAVLATQKEDGGWQPFFAQQSSPTYTVLALKLLVWLGVLDREELRRKVLAHIQS